MALKAFRGKPFEHTHENKAFDDLYDLLSAHCAATNQDWYLFGNFYVGSRELDALLIKPNTIIVLDFKAFSGALEFSEDGPWRIQPAEGSHVEVKGGASVNPLHQLRKNKWALREFFSRNYSDMSSRCNWGHIAATVAFSGPIEFDDRVLPGSIKPWFYVSDMSRVVRDLEAIVSREFSLTDDDMQKIVAQFGLDAFSPAGGPNTRILMKRVEGEDKPNVKLTLNQTKALSDFSGWITVGSGVYRLMGMVSTGKHFLLPYLVEMIKQRKMEPVLLVPSARYAEGWGHETVSIYTWLYSLLPSRFERIDDRKVAIHEINKNIDLAGKIPILLEAHLLGDEEFEIRDRRYGSGHLIKDLFAIFGLNKTPFVVIGDPYQLPRGSLERSLITGEVIEASGLSVTSCMLDEQIIDDNSNALSDFQSHLVDSLCRDRFNNIPRLSGEKLEIQEAGNTNKWVPDTTNVRAESIMVCATHGQASKLNSAVKVKLLKHKNPIQLAPGDRIDFHNRTPILVDENEIDFQTSTQWINSGSLALVDFVDQHIESHIVELRGRKEPVILRFQKARCRLPMLGEVEFRYLVDYFEDEKGEIDAEIILALQVLARKLVNAHLSKRKSLLPDKKHPDYKQARSEYDKFEYAILQSQGYLTAAQIRPAHALTVHRAQGRHWPHVWVDASRSSSSDKPNNAAYFRWLYTASVCAAEMLVIGRMPLLSPMSNAFISRAKDFAVTNLPVKNSLFYNTERVPTEQEIKMPLPTGFGDVKLLPLFLELHQRCTESDWGIDQWVEHSYQVVVSFRNIKSHAVVKLKLHYSKNMAVTNQVYIEGCDEDVVSVNGFIDQAFKPVDKAMAEAVISFSELISAHGFKIVAGVETSYRLQLTLIHDDDLALVEVNAGKDGMISKIRILKATSEAIAQSLESVLGVIE